MKIKNNKKTAILLVVSLILVFLVSAGTIAWLTRTNTVTNVFTVGTFKVPTTSPIDSSEITLDSHLYEPSWDEEEAHKITPGATFVKDPYVGIGAGSENAVVYVYVENEFPNKVYFTMNTGWEAVENETTAGSETDTYTSGLFKYTAGLECGTSQEGASEDAWTETPLFSSIVVDDTLTVDELNVETGNIEVSSFIHQAQDGSGDPIDDAIILEAAKTAFGIE